MQRDDTAGGHADVQTDGTAGTASSDYATERELRQGFVPVHETIDDRGRGLADPFHEFGGGDPGGFLHRPQGWER